MDGGLTALGGFLYQTIGALGLQAGAFQQIDQLSGTKDLETLLGFAKDGSIHYEDVDQDASIRYVLHDEQPGYILIQFKYSSQNPPETITKPDLEEILHRFRQSAVKARRLGRQVTGYSLRSNRPLNGPAESRHHQVFEQRTGDRVGAHSPQSGCRSLAQWLLLQAEEG